MTTPFIRDSKSLKEKLQDLIPWEVLLLNKLYNSSSQIFNSLAHFFQQQDVNYQIVQENIIEKFKELNVVSYSQYLSATSINPLIDSIYQISDQITSTSSDILSAHISHFFPDHLSTHEKDNLTFLTKSLRAEVNQIEIQTKLKGKILANSDLETLMNICNFVSHPKFNASSFHFLRLLDAIKTDDDLHFISEKLQYLDVLVMSALGHCRSWTRVFRDRQQSQKVIPHILKWAEFMKTEYKEFLDFQIHHSLLSKRHLRETAKKHVFKGYHSDFITAVRQGNYQEVEKLLHEGVSVESIDPNDKNKPALHIACQNGDMNMVKLLEKNGCNFEAIDFEHLTPIFYAVSSENLQLVQYLLDKGADIEHTDSQDRTPFYWACCQCSVKVVDFLYRKGSNVNALSRLSRSPLTKAAYLGRIDIAQLLLSYPETIVDLPGNKDRTALHNAVWGKAGGREGKRVGTVQKEDSPEIAKLLLERGSNINLKDSDGNTAIAIAAASHSDKSIPILMAFGADINVQNNAGETPLDQAVKWGHIQICKLLIENYAPNLFLKNILGHDCFETAIVASHFELVLYLLDKISQKIQDDDAYFDNILRLTARHFTAEERIKLLTLIVTTKTNPPPDFLSETTIRNLVRLKEEKIVKLIQEYLRIWNSKYNSPSQCRAKIHIMMDETLKMHWVKCCRELYSEYPQDIADMKWELRYLAGLENLKDEDLFFLIEHFNLDIFTPDEKGETLLHLMIRERNMNLLLELLTLLSDITKGKKTIANNYIKNIDMDFLKEVVKAKNKEGFSALDFALINKYYELHGVLTKFLGEDLEGSVRLAKYKVIVKDLHEEEKAHSMRDTLIAQEKKLKEIRQEVNQSSPEKKQLQGYIFDKSIQKEIIPSFYQIHPDEYKYLETALASKKDSILEKIKEKDRDRAKLKKKKIEENENIGTAPGVEKEEEAFTELKRPIKTEETGNPLEEMINQRELSFIETEKQLDALSQELKQFSLIGVDTEYFVEDKQSRVSFVCLIQISTIKQDYIVDSIKLHQFISTYLGPIFLSQDIVKVFHGCESDLKWLKADFNIDVMNLFDTGRALMLLNNVELAYSLAYLTSEYLGFTLDKSYQKADWRVRPLPQGMLEYARRDSSVLLYLWYFLDGELKYRGKEMMIKMTRNMIVKCWKTLEKSVRPHIDVISLE